jgi:HK97 family phage major capsid protein
MEDLNQRLTSLKEGLEGTIDAKVEQSVEKNMGSDYKNQLKGEVNELISKHGKVVEDLNSRIDSLELDKQKSLQNAPPKNFSANLKAALADSASFKSFMSGDSSKATLNLKAIMTTAANASGDTVPADRLNGFYYDPTRTTRVRDLLTTISTDSNTIRYIQETSYTNGAAARVEASAYGESEFKLDPVDAPVRSIGSQLTMTKEMFNDVPALSGYISTRIPAKVMNVEDNQLLFGAGTGANLQGLMTAGGGAAFNEASSAAFYQFFGANASAYTNEFDVLIAAKNQAQIAEYLPTAVMVNPTDYNKMFLHKDANANYVVFVNGVLTILGTPIYPSTAVTADKFIIGDFSAGATLAMREDMEISFSEQHSDNFVKDLVTVKATERIALPIHNPNAFVHGTFSTAIASLNA